MAATTFDVSLDERFLDKLDRLEGNDTRRAMRAVRHFLHDPDHPGLNFHPVEGDPTGRLYSIRAGQDLRILLAKTGNVVLILEVDHHDALYDLAERSRFVVAERSGFIGLVTADATDLPAAPTEAPPTDRAADATDRVGHLDHWSDGELMAAGFDSEAVAQLRTWTTADPDVLFSLPITDEQKELAFDLVEQTPDAWRSQSLLDHDDTEGRLRAAIAQMGSGTRFSRILSAEAAERLFSAPIEDWMIFLHPDQHAAVVRRYEGPARVRGSAGTGKTVVALHRAAALARRFQDEEQEPKPILFTTFIRSLPPVFESLYLRLPDAVPKAVHFTNVDKLASQLLYQARQRQPTDPRKIDAAYASAWGRIVTPGSALERSGFTRPYLREEITAVVKGRAIGTLDEYLELQRTGRRAPMGREQRRQAWELRQAWDEEIDRRGTVDFPDLVIAARDLARSFTEPRYRAAIIDEAQDLTLAGLQLIRALVNGPGPDRPDGLLIVGDGAQRIYPGGFTLRQAGIEVRGRTTVLTTNYRNTAAIIRAAMAVAGAEEVDDLGDVGRRGDAAAQTARDGIAPILVEAPGLDQQVDFITRQMERLCATDALRPGDVGVLVPTNRVAKAVLRGLADRGLGAQELAAYDGTPNDLVKVGTHHRAKGLEFKVVFLPELTDGVFPPPRQPGQSAEEYQDERALAISQLFVAMTRARDGLFLLHSGTPSEVIVDHLDQFEVIQR